MKYIFAAVALLLLIGLAFTPRAASAQTVPTAPYTVTPIAVPTPENILAGNTSNYDVGITKNGAWIEWYAKNPATGKMQHVIYVGTLAEFAKVGTRMQTIMKSPNPLAMLQTAGSRFPILPLTDPSLALIVADMRKAGVPLPAASAP